MGIGVAVVTIWVVVGAGVVGATYKVTSRLKLKLVTYPNLVFAYIVTLYVPLNVVSVE